VKTPGGAMAPKGVKTQRDAFIYTIVERTFPSVSVQLFEYTNF